MFEAFEELNQDKNDKIRTYEISKISLSCFEDKYLF